MKKNASRRFKAMASGLLLYLAALRCGVRLAEMQPLHALHEMLDGPRSDLTILLEATLIALIIFALATTWATLTIRPSAPGRRPLTGWCLGGVAIAWIAAVVGGVILVSSGPGINDMPISAWLLSPDMPPLWGLFDTLAVVAGVLLGGRIVRRMDGDAGAGPGARLVRT